TTVLPSLASQQLNQFQNQQQQIHIQQPNTVQSYNSTPTRVCYMNQKLLVSSKTILLSYIGINSKNSSCYQSQ
ncbi:unnamed protein product, partial [Rotaria magnacalcarata]